MADPLLSAAHAVLDGLEQRNLRLMDVLDALFWGNAALIDDSRLRGARTSFTHDPRLPAFLKRICSPPRTGKARTKSVAGASGALDDFAFEHVYDCYLAELRAYEETTVFDSDDIDICSIQEITLAAIVADVTKHAPRLYAWFEDLRRRTRMSGSSGSSSPPTSL